MSEVKVNKISPRSGTDVTLGDSSDTFTVPTGAGLTVTDEVKTNKISPATGVAFALGDSGDTFTIPSGATIVNSGTATGFGGGAWTIIDTQVASSDASLTVTGLDATYDMFALGISGMTPETDYTIPMLRMGDSGGIDSGASDYSWAVTSQHATLETRYDASDSECELFHQDGIGNGAEDSYSAMLYFTPNSGGAQQNAYFGTFNGQAPDTRYNGFVGGVRYNTHIALTQLQFYFASGDIATGRMTVWGISHA